MFLKCTCEIFDSTMNSVTSVYYNCLIRQVVLIDEIDASIRSFKLRLDFTKSNKYLTHCLTVKDFRYKQYKSNYLWVIICLKSH